jgi:hypothetical protein
MVAANVTGRPRTGRPLRGAMFQCAHIQYEHTTVLHTGETGGVDRAMQRIDRVLHREPLLRR